MLKTGTKTKWLWDRRIKESHVLDVFLEHENAAISHILQENHLIWNIIPTPHWNLNCMRNTSSNILAPIQFQWPARSFGTTQLLGKFRMRTSRKAACHELYLLATIEIVWETHIYILQPLLKPGCHCYCWILDTALLVLPGTMTIKSITIFWQPCVKTVGCRWPALTVCGTDMAAHGEKYQWHSI